MAESITESPTPTAIELRHLRYFLAVVERKHFGHAAEELHVSQPSVSKAIRQLEDGIGVQLLQRTRGAATPTEAGETFADEARWILAHLDRAAGEARRAAGAASMLRIGCLDYLPIERVERFVEALRRRQPTLHLTVMHLSMHEQIGRLREGALDLAILSYAEEHQDIAMQSISVGEPIEALLSRGHSLSGSRVIGPDELRDETLIQGPRAAYPALYDWFMALLEEVGYSFCSVRVVDTVNPRDLVLAVAAGEGIMLRPRSYRAVDEAGIGVTRAALNPELTMPDMMVAWRKNPPRYLGQVLAIVKEVASETRASAE